MIVENKAEEGELVDSRNSNDRFTDDELAIAKSVDLCAVAESLGYTTVSTTMAHARNGYIAKETATTR